MLRRLASLVAVTAVALGGVAVTAPSANAATSSESQFVSLTNGARSNKGLRSYSVSSDLVSVARRHAQRMASKGTIYHNPNLGSEVSGWQAVGENVGMGGSASSIHNAFMNSASHRANILDVEFTQVGIGVAYDAEGVMYVTEVFRKPYGSTTYTAPAPKPRATAAPRTRTAYRPTTATKRTPVAAPKPAAKKPAAAPKADPSAALRARLARARAVAASRAPSGALDHAVTYVNVMSSLA